MAKVVLDIKYMEDGNVIRDKIYFIIQGFT